MAKTLKSCVRQNWLILSTTLAVILGLIQGFGLRQAKLNPETVAWIQIWGELLIRMFKAIALPLIISCIVVGITGMQGRMGGKLGLGVIIYTVATSTIGITIAICLHLIIKPGDRLKQMGDLGNVQETDQSYTDLFTDVLRNLIPDNLVSACMETVYTVRSTEVQNITGLNNTWQIMEKEKRELHRRYGLNSLGMVLVSMVFAYAIRRQGDRGKPISDFLHSLSHVVFSIIDMINWYSPIGVYCLITGAIIAEKDIGQALYALLFFIISVILALILQAFIVLPVLYVVIVRKNPFALYARTVDALSLGFAAAASPMVMSLCLEKAEKRLQVQPEVANFVFPILLVFVKNGSAIFIAASVLFIAESQGIDLNATNIVIIGCLAGVVTTSVPSVPSGSIFVIILVSSAINIPVQNRLPLLFTVEWLLDRLRSTLNASAMVFGVPIIDKFASLFANHEDSDVNISSKSKEDILLKNELVIEMSVDSKNGKVSDGIESNGEDKNVALL